MHARTELRHRRGIALIVVLGTLMASSARAASALPPQDRRALLTWLRAGAYESTFTAEPEPHPTVSAHGSYVRTWYSPILVEDLRAGRSRFRKGAAMVKELYLAGPNGPRVGYSVMRKIRSRSGRTGRGWLFYETFDGTNAGVSFGRGLGVCTGCHRSGTDYLLSTFRPFMRGAD